VDDWERRPLPEKLLKYAATDVQYLPELRDRLAGELQKDGRLEWAREEFRVLEVKAVATPHECWERVKGGGSLEGRDLAVLASLAAWREHEAARVNQPRQRIVNDRTLLELARQAPKRKEDVHVSRFFRVDQVRRYGEAILKAVQDGATLPPDQWPRKDRADHSPHVPQPTLDLMCAFVKHRSEEIGVGPARLATRDDVTDLAVAVVRRQNGGSRLMSGWRWDCVGRDLAALLNGQLSIRVRGRRLETFKGTEPESGTSN
jgi:ribonuclease D